MTNSDIVFVIIMAVFSSIFVGTVIIGIYERHQHKKLNSDSIFTSDYKAGQYAWHRITNNAINVDHLNEMAEEKEEPELDYMAIMGANRLITKEYYEGELNIRTGQISYSNGKPRKKLSVVQERCAQILAERKLKSTNMKKDWSIEELEDINRKLDNHRPQMYI